MTRTRSLRPTRSCALVVWDEPHPVVVDEQWLLATAERISRSLPIY